MTNQKSAPDRPFRRAGSATARRTAARLTAVQMLYQAQLSDQTPMESLRQYTDHFWARTLDDIPFVPADLEYAERVLQGFGQNKDRVTEILTGALDTSRSLDRIEPLLRCILQAGAAELLTCTDTDAAITIKDYVVVAESFYDGPEKGLVNAVLDKIGKTLRPSSESRSY